MLSECFCAFRHVGHGVGQRGSFPVMIQIVRTGRRKLSDRLRATDCKVKRTFQEKQIQQNSAKKSDNHRISDFLVGEGGFEPPKSLTTDLQSAPFGHSGIPPYSIIVLVGGAGRRIRTPDLLITNQLLYQLSYTSISATNRLYITRLRAICQ